MVEAKVTSKGQLTLPKAIRDQLGIREGDTVRFVVRGGSAYLERLPPEVPGVAFGVLRRGGKASVDVETVRADYRAFRAKRAASRPNSASRGDANR